jgi:hypothetical protein
MAASQYLPTGDFFQLGYVTGDLDKSMTFFRESQGVDSFFTFDTRALFPDGDPSRSHVRVGLAYLGTVMIELIEPDAKNAGIYGDALRGDGGLMLHHLGYLITPDVHAGLVDRLTHSGIAVPAASDGAGIAYIYADTRKQNGLFTEFVRKCDSSAEFFASVPRYSECS